MRPDLTDPILSRWLDAEQAAGDAEGRHTEEAEEALLALFERLPALAPPAGFACRVLRRIALEAPAAAPLRTGLMSRLARSRGFRVAVAGGLVATGAALFWLPQVLVVLTRLVTLSDVIQVGVASVLDLGRWLSLLARIGEFLLTVSGALEVSLASPAAVKVIAACLAVSGVSFVFLRDLMTRDRSWSYVDPMQ